MGYSKTKQNKKINKINKQNKKTTMALSLREMGGHLKIWKMEVTLSDMYFNRILWCAFKTGQKQVEK